MIQILPFFLFLKVSSYLLAEDFLSRCLSVLAEELRPENCLKYLNLAQEICCADLKMTVFTYLSRNMMELSHFIRYTILNDLSTLRDQHFSDIAQELLSICSLHLGLQTSQWELKKPVRWEAKTQHSIFAISMTWMTGNLNTQTNNQLIDYCANWLKILKNYVNSYKNWNLTFSCGTAKCHRQGTVAK